MKLKILLLLLVFISNNTFAQTVAAKNPLHLTREQQYKDSIEFAKFKQKNPELFLSKRLPVKLVDNSYVVIGFSTGIKIQNNRIKDSVYHNFHPGMPDTSTVIPFNDIQVTDASIKIDLFSHLIMFGGKFDSAVIAPADTSLIVDNKIGRLPIGDFFLNSTAIKISINGKLLFDWKTLNNFPKQAFKASENFKPAENYVGYGVSAMYGYIYGYDICDTRLNMNDQLLIEIKNIGNNWMIDRYNITRVAVTANLSSVYSIEKKRNIFGGETNGMLLKKTFTIEAGDEKLLLYPYNRSFANNSEIEYSLIKDNSNDTSWASVSGFSALPLQVDAGNDYTLLLRYKFQPVSINKYTFHIKPHWWQTLLFKIFAAFLIIIILFLSIFYFYTKTKKQHLLKQQEETERGALELKAIRSQLNPHFIFNSLSSIQGLINSNKIDAANFYLSEFSSLMRNTLVESDKIFQPLEQEIKVLETYLKIEQLRFQFEYKINTDANIKINEIEIPSLLLQPLVENAVKHGVSELREKGKISIHFFITANNLIAEIKDNGSGFDDKNKTNGFGSKLTNDRIKLLNKMNKDQRIEKSIFRINNETVIQIIFKNIN